MVFSSDPAGQSKVSTRGRSALESVRLSTHRADNRRFWERLQGPKVPHDGHGVHGRRGAFPTHSGTGRCFHWARFVLKLLVLSVLHDYKLIFNLEQPEMTWTRVSSFVQRPLRSCTTFASPCAICTTWTSPTGTSSLRTFCIPIKVRST